MKPGVLVEHRFGTGMASFSRVVRITTVTFFGTLLVGLMVLALVSSSLFGLSRDDRQRELGLGWVQRYCQ